MDHETNLQERSGGGAIAQRSGAAVAPACATRTIRLLSLVEADVISGSAKAVVELAQEAARQLPGLPQLDISVVTFVRGHKPNQLVATLRGIGVTVETVEESGAFDLRILPQLRRIFDRSRPDVIWTNAVKSHFLVRLLGFHRRARWVAFHHGYTRTHWRTILYNQLDRWSPRAAGRVVTVCCSFADQLASFGMEPARVRVQHMPIRPRPVPDPAAVAKLREQLGIGPKAVALLSVGRLSREKGHADLIEAFATLARSCVDTDLRLLLVGDGPERSHLVELARQRNLAQSVTFAGQQDHIRPYYSLADIFVLPSHSEGSPNVLLEAIEAGIPVVATAVGGIPEIVAADRSALLVPAHNPAALAAAMQRLLADPHLRARLASCAKEVLATHTPEDYFRNMVAVFEELLAS